MANPEKNKSKGPITSATEAMVGFKSMQPTAKQFCTFLRAKLSHADPRITDVKMWWDPALDYWRFSIYVNYENKFGYNISGETIDHMAQGNYDQAVETVFDQISIAFYKQFPKPKTPPKLLGNHNYINYTSNPNDNALDSGVWDNIQKMLDSGLNKDQIKELMLSGHPIIASVPSVDPVKPIPFESKPTAPPPTPPVQDKFYGLSPEDAYNISLEQIKQSAVQHKYSNDVHGFLLQEVKEQQKLLAEYQAAKHKKFKEAYGGKIGTYSPNSPYSPKGFNGHVVQDSLRDVLPCLYEVVKCPAQGCPSNRVMSEQIIHLNDEHEWTREAIADWAESLDIDISVKEREE